jgi:ABC-type methionine transport system ATPase subunit
MFLNRELLRWGPLRLLNHREMRRRAAVALAEIGVDVPSVELEVGALSGGQRQAIAVARAVYSKARILLLDEPLAAMGAREARLIIGLIERLRARGDIAIVMIAHNYAQTLEICDRVLLMQHGEITFESQAAATSSAAKANAFGLPSPGRMARCGTCCAGRASRTWSGGVARITTLESILESILTEVASEGGMKANVNAPGVSWHGRQSVRRPRPPAPASSSPTP